MYTLASLSLINGTSPGSKAECRPFFWFGQSFFPRLLIHVNLAKQGGANQ